MSGVEAGLHVSDRLAELVPKLEGDQRDTTPCTSE